MDGLQAATSQWAQEQVASPEVVLRLNVMAVVCVLCCTCVQVALEEQGQKAALAWKWQQEVARLQEKLGKRSLEVLARDQEIQALKPKLQELTDQLQESQAANVTIT